MTKLTKRQQEILNLIQTHMAKAGSPPTRAEIAKTMGFKSPNAAEDHLRALARKGVIELVPGTSRGIRVSEKLMGIPVLKLEQIHAQPLLSPANTQGMCKLDRDFFGTPIDLIVQLSSDISELHLNTGDYLAIHLTSSLEHKQLGLVRLHNRWNILRNDQNLPEDSEIQGKVVGILRTLGKPLHHS